MYIITAEHDKADALLEVTLPGTPPAKYRFPAAKLVTVSELVAQDLGLERDIAASNRGWLDALGTHGIAVIGNATSRSTVVAAYRESQIREIAYAFPSRENRPGAIGRKHVKLMPRLWVLKWESGRLQNSWLLVPANDIMTLPITVIDTFTPLNAFQLGNVHQHGVVCWGTVSKPPFGLGVVSALDSLFFDSPFNGDLSMMRGSLRSWLHDTPPTIIDGQEVLVMKRSHVTEYPPLYLGQILAARSHE